MLKKSTQKQNTCDSKEENNILRMKSLPMPVFFLLQVFGNLLIIIFCHSNLNVSRYKIFTSTFKASQCATDGCEMRYVRLCAGLRCGYRYGIEDMTV